MKRYWYLMAIAATLLASCNKDEEETEIQGFKVLEYRPAPGQFINEGFDCQTMEEANAYAEERFNKKLYVSLGSFGGYITVKMPKEIKNRKGYDFGIIGNPFSGSSEPGIVWVSEDANGNGKADDVWYELKGSDEPERDYSVTYHRPDAAGDIPWEDSKGESGVIKYLPQYHDQMYYPNWIKEDSYTLKGSMLEARTEQEGGIWKNKDFGKGYADNWGSDMAKDDNGNYRYNQFDLDDAVDQNGNPVTLERIHFVKVQSAILKNVESIGEVSTEVVGFKALNELFKVMDLPSLLSCKRQINYLSLSRIGLQLSCTREAIKRESGESPEQSRCCKFIFWLRAIDFIATGKQIPGRRSQQEQVRRPTMQTRFTAFEEKAMSLMNRTIRPSFHSPF